MNCILVDARLAISLPSLIFEAKEGWVKISCQGEISRAYLKSNIAARSVRSFALLEKMPALQGFDLVRSAFVSLRVGNKHYGSAELK